MTNAQILSQSINQWLAPYVQASVNNFANQGMLGTALSQLISIDRLMVSVTEHLSVPMMEQYISKLPDAVIPAFSLDVIDGMIEKRLKEGAFQIPMLGISLNPDAFKKLREVCEENFKTYGEQSDE